MKRDVHSIVLYTKGGCLLCDEVRDMLKELKQEFAFTIEEVDILRDISLYERFKNTIPVVVIDGSFTLEGRIEELALRNYLAE